ncbi:DUF2164 domain-containing protein [Kiloniella laminariae]|uniref:DUF2164 domain-containing protein n=1 Tax=Kiloniella laminariae TaxID=454162 RepID=UPI00037B03F3|nr:DUF2164 domain-containing protein [Kiloniella laminariae]
MSVKLASDRKSEIIQELVSFYYSEFDENLSDFRAEALVDFLHRKLGPSHYNQGIADARKYMAEKIDDLDAQFYLPEE